MLDPRFIKQSLALHGVPVHNKDIPYLQHILYTIYQAQAPLQTVK